LVEERELLILKFLEPLVPTDRLERAFTRIARKIDPDHADIPFASGAIYRRRVTTVDLDPAPDLAMIGRRL
jgi:hypothetical protein